VVPTRSARCSSSLHYSPVPACAALGRGQTTGVSHCRTLSNIVHVSTLCARHHREQPRVTNPCHATVTLTSCPHLRLILRRHFVQYYGKPLSSSLVELAMLRLCRPVHGFFRYYGTVRPYDQYQGAPASSDTMPRPVLRRPVLCPILRAAVSSTMVTSGPATTTSHSTMSRLRSILWLWSDPMGVSGSMAPSYHVVLHYGSIV
jgi:hypothetical protein